MAINISKLARMGEFNLELQSLGTIRCVSLNTEHLSQAHKKLGLSGAQGLDIVRWLFGEMARRPVEGRSDEDEAIEGASLAKEELSSITDEELEEFAKKLIQKNKYLLKTHKGGDIEKSADESACAFLVRAFRHYAAEQKAQTKPTFISQFANLTAEAVQRNIAQQSALGAIADANRFLTMNSAIAAMEAELIDAKMKDMAKAATGAFHANAAAEAVQRNIAQKSALDAIAGTNQFLTKNSIIAAMEAERIDAKVKDMAKAASGAFRACTPAVAAQGNFELSNQYQDTIDKLTPSLSATKPIFSGSMPGESNHHLLAPHILKNPIHETNEKLGNVVKQIEDLRPTAAKAEQLFRENAATTGRQAKIAIGIAAVSLVSSLFFSYQSYVDAKASGEKNDAQIKAFQKENRDLAAAQREEQAALVKAIMAEQRRASATAIKK